MTGSPSKRPAVAVAALSGGIFLLEILLTRIFSATLFHHFAFAAISLGMLGLAAGAVRVATRPGRYSEERGPGDVVSAMTRFSLAAGLALVVAVRIGISPSFSWARLALLLGLYVVCAVPFYLGGLGLALLFTHHRRAFARLYAVDLLAAGASGLVAFPMLRFLGAPAAVAATAGLVPLLATAAFPEVPGRSRVKALACGLLFAILVAGDRQAGWLRLRDAKESGARPLLYEAWNAVSRVGVYRGAMQPWSLSPRYRGPLDPGLMMDIDAGAATAIVPAAAGPGNDYLRFEMTTAAWLVAPKERALVIGAGGGRDVLAALLWGARRVDAVEINPIIANDIMRGLFRKASGDLYFDPRVSVHVADGRSFVRRSKETYDLIQLSMVDTWAATAAGAFALSENNLYTREAVEEYLEHLSPNGVLTLTRWAGGETRRLVVLVHAAARGSGDLEPARHMAVLQHRDAVRSVEAVPAVVIYRRSPFDQEVITPLREYVEACGFAWLHDPLEARNNRISEIARASDAEREARRSEDYDIAPPTDDRPFFFYRARPFLAGLLEDPSRLFSEGQYLVALLLALSTVMAAASILLPIGRRAGNLLRSEAAVAIRTAPYFAALGAGFMLVEMALMQRFVLYLGHPTHALTTVLVALLLGAGLGSALAARLPSGSAWRLAAVVVAVLIASTPLERAVFAASQELGFLGKVLITIALVLPLGALQGTLMPLGIARLSARSPGLVPWAWGVNGFMSVLGTTSAVMLSMSYGFGATLAVGAACYALACAVSSPLGLWRAEDELASAA